MASLFTHAFTAAALAPMLAPRPGWRWTIAAGILASTLPDADVFGYYLGVPYRSFFGHRGVTHSLLFALLVAWATVHLLRARTPLAPGARFRQGIYLFACCASHAVLDAMTTGGYGVGLFMPFANERIFFGWTPILVSPLGVQNFFTPYGAQVFISELRAVWLPLGAVALTCAYARSALTKPKA